MRGRSFGTFVVLALLGLAAIHVWNSRRGQLRVGDTLIPKLDHPLEWEPGRPGVLGVRLQAQGQDDKAARLLDFGAIPDDVNPVAHITFSDPYEVVTTQDVTLSYRC